MTAELFMLPPLSSKWVAAYFCMVSVLSEIIILFFLSAPALCINSFLSAVIGGSCKQLSDLGSFVTCGLGPASVEFIVHSWVFLLGRILNTAGW